MEQIERTKKQLTATKEHYVQRVRTILSPLELKYDSFLNETYVPEAEKKNQSQLKLFDRVEFDRRSYSATAKSGPRRLKSIPTNQFAKRLKRNADISKEMKRTRLTKAPTVEI